MERRHQAMIAGAVAAALLVGFGGGFLVAKGLGHHAAGPGLASEPAGFTWPFFGKPRAANAPRGACRRRAR